MTKRITAIYFVLILERTPLNATDKPRHVVVIFIVITGTLVLIFLIYDSIEQNSTIDLLHSKLINKSERRVNQIPDPR